MSVLFLDISLLFVDISAVFLAIAVEFVVSLFCNSDTVVSISPAIRFTAGIITSSDSSSNALCASATLKPKGLFFTLIPLFE